ncbi:hypothetical protein H8356DRAFT_1437326 [Neocallimastix lanati (nom. inval.)]|nr:hypothetical protein H8356DRAFT_1437326 [Neocallimastix sp. JGI-2020a]
MINCHTGTAKETPYRSTLRDPRGKAEPTIGAGHCKSSQTRLTQWDSNSVRNIENLERKNREDMILVGVDPETFELDDYNNDFRAKFNLHSNWASRLWTAVFYIEYSSRGTRVA